MSSEEVLRLNEENAVNGSEEQIVSRVVGKNLEKEGKQGKFKKWGAAGAITAILLVLLLLVSSGNMIPSAISERLIEATDVQYADAVESKILVFQQALTDGAVPANTVERLKQNGVLVGNVAEGGFTESANGTALLIEASTMENSQVVTAGNFASEVHANAKLYKAFTEATYARAAYWYDDAAEKVFREIGTSRNNYTSATEFEEVMDKLMGEGNKIEVNNVVLAEKENEDGEKYYEYELLGADAAAEAAESFVSAVGAKNTAADKNTATLNAADTLNVADTTAKEQRSSIFFLSFMENISKMKAGGGNNAKINEAMNFLYRNETSEVVDTATGQVVTTEGSMLEAPSLYAVLSGEKIDTRRVENYASDRVLKTVENQVGVGAASAETLSGTVTSTSSKVRGSIGRFIDSTAASADTSSLSTVVPTIAGSLVDNSFGSVKGVAGGELLVEGAVNVGRKLALQSGATAGDASAVKSYARLTSSVLALDAGVDRMSRSPFDISSPNTFLGSIVYKFATVLSKNSSWLRGLSTVGQTAASSAIALLPASYADDNEDLYIANFGNSCETLASVGAVGTAACSTVATFDTSTLNNTFNDAGFIKFVEENTTLENGTRKIKADSVLANFIKYNDERKTTVGVTDGGILKSLAEDSSGSIPFVSDILAMIKIFLGASEEDKRVASGESFVNSASNPDWETYKYAQRYVSLARATDTLRAYDGDETAYNDLKFFEGAENPVVAFLNEYYNIASR